MQIKKNSHLTGQKWATGCVCLSIFEAWIVWCVWACTAICIHTKYVQTHLHLVGNVQLSNQVTFNALIKAQVTFGKRPCWLCGLFNVWRPVLRHDKMWSYAWQRLRQVLLRIEIISQIFIFRGSPGPSMRGVKRIDVLFCLCGFVFIFAIEKTFLNLTPSWTDAQIPTLKTVADVDNKYDKLFSFSNFYNNRSLISDRDREKQQLSIVFATMTTVPSRFYEL